MTKDMKHTSEEQDVTVQDSTVEDINYDLVASGPLYVDPKHKKPGYEYCWVADRPGEIDMYKRWGYLVVQDEFRVGDTTASTTSRFGSAVTCQSKCGTMLVFMAIPKELHTKLMAYREGISKARERSLGHIEGVPEHLQKFNGEDIGEYKVTKK